MKISTLLMALMIGSTLWAFSRFGSHREGAVISAAPAEMTGKAQPRFAKRFDLKRADQL